MTYITAVSSHSKQKQVLAELEQLLNTTSPVDYMLKVEKIPNGFEVFQFCGGAYVPVRKYVVLLLPITFNFSAVQTFQGSFSLDCTDLIKTMETITAKLRELCGTYYGEERGSDTYDNLAASLRGL